MPPPPKLYKYVTQDRIDVLTSGLIRYTQPTALNDPFELVPVFEALLTEEDIQSALSPSEELLEESFRRHLEKIATKEGLTDAQIDAAVEYAMSEANRNPELLQSAISNIEPEFRNGIKQLAPFAHDFLTEKFQTELGILSLTEIADDLLMWAHYGANHQGFAFEFNSNHEYFNRRRTSTDEFYHLRKVSYLDKSPIGKTLMDLDGEDLLARKMSNWAYEKEWRVIAPIIYASTSIKADGNDVHLFDIPLDSITGVILGAHSKPELHCIFWPIPITDSVLNRSPILEHSDH